MGIFKNLKKALEDKDNATCLNLSLNKNTSLPEELSLLPNLKELYIKAKNIEELSLAKLPQLEYFSLQNEQNLKLSHELFEHPNLKTLSLNNCLIQTFPQLKKDNIVLENLYLNNNDLEELPLGLSHLKALKVLFLGSNKIKSLPADIAQYNSLQRLILDSNQLEKCPMILKQATKLLHLSIDNNPFSEEERAIIERELKLWF